MPTKPPGSLAHVSPSPSVVPPLDHAGAAPAQASTVPSAPSWRRLKDIPWWPASAAMSRSPAASDAALTPPRTPVTSAVSAVAIRPHRQARVRSDASGSDCTPEGTAALPTCTPSVATAASPYPRTTHSPRTLRARAPRPDPHFTPHLHGVPRLSIPSAPCSLRASTPLIHVHADALPLVETHAAEAAATRAAREQRTRRHIHEYEASDERSQRRRLVARPVQCRND